MFLSLFKNTQFINLWLLILNITKKMNQKVIFFFSPMMVKKLLLRRQWNSIPMIYKISAFGLFKILTVLSHLVKANWDFRLWKLLKIDLNGPFLIHFCLWNGVKLLYNQTTTTQLQTSKKLIISLLTTRKIILFDFIK